MYYRSNYYWYLKAELEFSGIPTIKWTHDLFCIFSETEVLVTKWVWRHDTGNGKCYVVDGRKIQVSDFNKGLIPPPMCHYTISLPSVPIHISINEEGCLAVLLT